MRRAVSSGCGRPDLKRTNYKTPASKPGFFHEMWLPGPIDTGPNQPACASTRLGITRNGSVNDRRLAIGLRLRSVELFGPLKENPGGEDVFIGTLGNVALVSVGETGGGDDHPASLGRHMPVLVEE